MFQLAKSILTDIDGVVGTHSGGNVCIDGTLQCRYIPLLLNTYRQAERLQPHLCRFLHLSAICWLSSQVFGHSQLALTAMPMWQILHGFIIGSGNVAAINLSEGEIHKAIQSRLTKPVRFYSGKNHAEITHVPQRYAMYLNKIRGVLDDTSGLNKPDYVPSDWRSCSCDKKCVALEDGEDGTEAATGAERQTDSRAEDENEAEDDEEESEEL